MPVDVYVYANFGGDVWNFFDDYLRNTHKVLPLLDSKSLLLCSPIVFLIYSSWFKNVRGLKTLVQIYIIYYLSS